MVLSDYTPGCRILWAAGLKLSVRTCSGKLGAGLALPSPEQGPTSQAGTANNAIDMPERAAHITHTHARTAWEQDACVGLWLRALHTSGPNKLEKDMWS